MMVVVVVIVMSPVRMLHVAFDAHLKSCFVPSKTWTETRLLMVRRAVIQAV